MTSIRTIALVIFGLFIGAASPSGLASEPLPKGFFELRNLEFSTSFQDETGRPVSLESFRGRVVVLNLWATWCAPCIKEMPSLDRLSKVLPADKFAVVAVSQDNAGVLVAKPFLAKLGVMMVNSYFDPRGRVSRDLSARGLPTTVIVSSKGTLISRLEGAIEWDAQEVVSYLKSLTH